MRAADWNAAGAGPLRVAVNLSARQFADEGLVRDIAGALDRAGARPDCLEVEITESVAVQDIEATARILRELRALGVAVAMDDFGTGHSSLGALRRLDVDVIKIDRSFVADVVRDPRAGALCEAILRMAEALGKRVIAEGVETREQLEHLAARGCRVFQGHFIGLPQPAAQIPLHPLAGPRILTH